MPLVVFHLELVTIFHMGDPLSVYQNPLSLGEVGHISCQGNQLTAAGNITDGIAVFLIFIDDFFHDTVNLQQAVHPFFYHNLT